MRPLGAAEILDLERYAGVRPDYRAQVIAYKRGRRMAVGENVSLVFEDRETLRFQVQEMLWVERVTEPAKIQAELDVYNELMPGAGELSATLFLEIVEASEIRPTLERLVGLDRHVELVLGEGEGEGEGETLFHARFDRRQFDEQRVSAVQYIRFPLGADGTRRLADSSLRARLRVDHPHYRREEEIPPAVRESLVASLAREPAALLRPPDRA